MKDLRLVRKQDVSHHSTITVGSGKTTLHIGATEAIAMMAGPCAIESYEQAKTVTETLQRLGIPCLRGGVFKPRTSPYSFQGMGAEGIELLNTLKAETGILVASEVMTVDQVGLVQDCFDLMQIGSRNMQNFDLLKAVGRQEKPVLLKRGLSATIEEFLYAAEYIMSEGNQQVILCERGIRSFDPMTRNVLDLAAVALLKEMTHLPVIVDPSHATGKASLIEPASRAAIAIGADGLIVEAHPCPSQSVSDAAQALSLEELAQLCKAVTPIAEAIQRPIGLSNTENSTKAAIPA